jgi:hypothetical protein
MSNSEIEIRLQLEMQSLGYRNHSSITSTNVIDVKCDVIMLHLDAADSFIADYCRLIKLDRDSIDEN